MKETILSVQNLCKSFSGNKALKNVSLELYKGEITGLIGANGAGKTTFFNCIAGHYHATSGKVIYAGKEIQKWSSHRICHAGIARTFQIAKPFGDLTVRDNAVIGSYNHFKNKVDAYKVADECVHFVGLGDKLNSLAKNLNTGDQRRLELARAIATKPDLLLLDEVMAGLTPAESADIIQVIQKINESGVSILMIEHIMPVIMSLSDVIHVFDRGELIASGKPEVVTKDPRVIESYLGR